MIVIFHKLDLPTVGELMRPIKGESYNARSFELEPERYLFQTFINLSCFSTNS